MNVSDAVQRRASVRAFKPDLPPAPVVRAILENAARAPSGGNLQPWHVHALAGEPLAQLLHLVATDPMQDAPEYAVYPPDLWEPYRTRRWRNAEQLYAALGIPREDRVARLQQMQKNATFFGAPVGIFLSVDRRVGPPQWADLGIYLQTVMLLATEQGLDTCAQEYWAFCSQPVRRFLGLPPERMLFAGLALGWRDESAPVNQWRTERDAFEAWGEMRGF
jgi:nitroreductase